jgi:hypothetical protein
MRRSDIAPAFAFVLALSLAASGCRQLFTTSLGASLARDEPPTPEITSLSDLEELYDDLIANPDVAAASMDEIVALANSTSDPATKAAIAELAVSIAIEASGAGQAMNHLAELLDDPSPDMSDVAAILDTISLDPGILAAAAFASDSSVTTDGSTKVLAGALLALSDIETAGLDLATASDAELLAAIDDSTETLITDGVSELGDSSYADTFAGFLGL